MTTKKPPKPKVIIPEAPKPAEKLKGAFPMDPPVESRGKFAMPLPASPEEMREQGFVYTSAAAPALCLACGNPKDGVCAACGN